MATLKETATAYEPPQTKNITDLEKVDVYMETVEKEYTRVDETTFKLTVVELEGQDYRVPATVLKSLKAMLKEKPDFKFFKVKKDGEGLKTSYTVIPL